ncbi:MAG: hypothetical protein WAM14_20670 [Candidatus Nitrosopolaris sp.]
MGSEIAQELTVTHPEKNLYFMLQLVVEKRVSPHPSPPALKALFVIVQKTTNGVKRSNFPTRTD